MNIDLTGKKAIIGGASKGIGRAAAITLASSGAEVTLLARNAEKLAQLCADLNAQTGRKHHYLAADTGNTDELRQIVAAHAKAQGPFHILINNSGGPPAGPAHLAKPEEFLAAFTQHLIGNHVMMQSLLDGMKAEKYGRIVNIISTSVKQPIRGLGVSNTVRWAVAGWAKTLAAELGPFGITVNNILPGATDTDRQDEIFRARAAQAGRSLEEIMSHELALIPTGRFAQPDETAAAIAFLASPAAAYINGINLPVDGGRLASL